MPNGDPTESLSEGLLKDAALKPRCRTSSTKWLSRPRGLSIGLS